MIYVYAIDDNKCITHDGDVEIGIFNFGAKKFLELVKAEATETYWRPEPHGKRYKRANFQKHERVAGKSALELPSIKAHPMDRHYQNEWRRHETV